MGWEICSSHRWQDLRRCSAPSPCSLGCSPCWSEAERSDCHPHQPQPPSAPSPAFSSCHLPSRRNTAHCGVHKTRREDCRQRRCRKGHRGRPGASLQRQYRSCESNSARWTLGVPLSEHSHRVERTNLGHLIISPPAVGMLKGCPNNGHVRDPKTTNSTLNVNEHQPLNSTTDTPPFPAEHHAMVSTASKESSN